MSMQKIKIIIRWGVTLVLLFILISKIDLLLIFNELKNIQIGWVVVAFLVRGLALVFNTFRWNILLLCHNIRVNFLELFKARLVGVFYNNILPSNIGGDIIRVYFVSHRKKVKIAKVFSTVVIEKISGAAALSLYVLIAIFLISILLLI